MARLEIRLLGGFEVALDGSPVTAFESASAQALLARLASDPGLQLRRPVLAEMLWPDRPAGNALANLRHSLAVLRRIVGDHGSDRPVLVGGGDTITVDPGADVWIDVAEFRLLACTPPTAARAVAAWESATALWHGSFLAGFDPALSEEWDTWLLSTRTVIDSLAAGVLDRLAALRERSGELTRALELTHDELEISPWSEPAHCRLVRLLALDNRHAEAVAHAERFIGELEEQLGVRPTDELAALLDQVRSDRLADTGAVVPGLSPTTPVSAPVEPCVARDDELDWLHGCLDESVGGAGRVVFVSGTAGSGKTVLLRTFASAARDRMPQLSVLRGTCNAFTGPGDPYLPFRQILGLLCGDLERAWREGELAPSEAARLWAGVPAAVEAVLDHGPSLLASLIDGAALVHRFDGGYREHPLRPRLAAAVDDAARQSAAPLRQQQPILDQTVQVLSHLAVQRPMLLIIDDLHWADSGTIDLLRHLASRLTGSPILVVTSFRPNEASSATAEVDPIAVMAQEARAQSGSECLLRLAGSRHFVDAWLDTEPNLLDEAFRERLFRATHGHALFTVEMVAAMHRRDDIIEDDRGRQVSSGVVAWDRLPRRIQATIAARTMQLAPELRRDLEVASVQGETFVAEVLATTRSADDVELGVRLGGLTEPTHALIEFAGSDRIGDTRLHRYRFRHALFRQFLYDGLAEQDRTALHETTGRALAELYGDHEDEAVVEIAHHIDEAGLVEEAIGYHGRAGRRAMRLSATTEAVAHLRRALELVGRRQPSVDRDHVELDLLSALGACLQAQAGYNAPETQEVYERLRHLIPDVGPTLESAEALGSLIAVDGLRAHYGDAISGSEQLLTIAAELDAPPLEAIAHMQLGWLLFMTARLVEAEEHLDRAIEMYEPDWDHWLTYTVGFHVRSTARAWRATVAWYLGRPDQARRDATTSIAEARRVGYPFGLAFALSVAGCVVSELRLESDDVVTAANEVATIADQQGFAFYRAAALVHRGNGVAIGGDLSSGLRDLEEGLAGWSELGTEAFRPWIMCSLAEFLVEDARVDAAARVLTAVEQQLATGEERLASCWLPLARAAIHRARGDNTAAEAELRGGITLLQNLGARGPELRSATALAGLLCDLDRFDEAGAVLEPVLESFTEGSETADIQAARAMLRTASERRR